MIGGINSDVGLKINEYCLVSQPQAILTGNTPIAYIYIQATITLYTIHIISGYRGKENETIFSIVYRYYIYMKIYDGLECLKYMSLNHREYYMQLYLN